MFGSKKEKEELQVILQTDKATSETTLIGQTTNLTKAYEISKDRIRTVGVYTISQGGLLYANRTTRIEIVPKAVFRETFEDLNQM